MNKKFTIAIASSTGGHMVQARLLESVYGKYEHFYFTFNGGVAENMKKDYKVYSIPNITKRKPLSWISGFINSFIIAYKTKPDIVITTGAGIVVFFCLFSKLFGSKIIFIESMARIKSPTLTARMIYPFADLFIVQWEGLTNFFPKAQYVGRLF